MLTNLDSKMKFIELIDKMKYIKRVVRLKNSNEFEDDSQHSYDLLALVMILLDDFPDLDKSKCYCLAILHDLVEIFAGDTYIFDERSLKTKEIREQESLNKIESILGKQYFKPYRQLIEEYENKSSKEARFVYQLDKINPIIQIVSSGGIEFRENKVTEEQVTENKYSKVDEEFGLKELLDRYFDFARKGNMFYV